MLLINRSEELARLDRLATGRDGGLAVLTGRRRIGKTRVLVEWSARHGGLYTVADQSSPDIQRRYFAEAVAGKFPGFADVEYRDWRGLLRRLTQEAQSSHWRGPIIFDEFPYLVTVSPELPSILQRWIDHEARSARLVIAIAGSSQRMMQGLVLSSDAPLFGRATEILELKPLEPGYLREAFPSAEGNELVENYAAWGGIPRYWELASGLSGDVRARVESLALDPLGPLHHEPDRLLIEEIPSAQEVRPVLDAIGAGAHRVSEIAARAGRPATSMSRPLERLVGMGLARREVPFGESARKSKRALYKIDDPFFRLWFRIVAPHRAQLATSPRRSRLALLDRHWNAIVSGAWEDMCRLLVTRVSLKTPVGRLGPWGPASRWWLGAMPEWDIVSESQNGRRLLLGEAKWNARPAGTRALQQALVELASKPAPFIGPKFANHEIVRVLFVPRTADSAAPRGTGSPIAVMTCSDLLK